MLLIRISSLTTTYYSKRREYSRNLRIYRAFRAVRPCYQHPQFVTNDMAKEHEITYSSCGGLIATCFVVIFHFFSFLFMDNHH
jgi:hypothetical protein